MAGVLLKRSLETQVGIIQRSRPEESYQRMIKGWKRLLLQQFHIALVVVLRTPLP